MNMALLWFLTLHVFFSPSHPTGGLEEAKQRAAHRGAWGSLGGLQTFCQGADGEGVSRASSSQIIPPRVQLCPEEADI